MKIHEILDRDPRASALANNGQARITELRDERTRAELRAELETFVCDGQYGKAIERILQSYLRLLDRPRQDAAWVSGFFGSGKSHLLKMLGHLWVDTEFPDGSTARTLVRGLSDDIRALFRELDGKVKRSGRRSVAATGTLPSGTSENVRLTVLSIILRACDLPEQYPQARFCFWLRERGILDEVRAEIENAGRDWRRELNNLYVSAPIANAILAHDPHFAADERQARQVLREQFPNRAGDITTAEFLDAARNALSPDGGDLPLTILVLDEVQQYIGDSNDCAGTVTELAEAIQTQMDSRVLLVASGQAALAGQTGVLRKLTDRFRIAVQLSDADVEAVTRKVLLQKKASAIDAVQSTIDSNAGEVSKHLQGSRIGERSEDRHTIVADYPLLPVRRRFWEECFRVIDEAGTHSQLRSQLRILHDALQQIADHDLSRLITADALYEALAPDMVNTGVLLNEINNRIQSLDDGSDEGRLRKRICALVFLINKLPQGDGKDIGVRATARSIADLLVNDLNADSGPLRQRVADSLKALADDGTLMQVGEEYRLQTTEGAEWDRAFRERMKVLREDERELSDKRDQLLGASVQDAIAAIKLIHGQSKVRRDLHLHVGPGDPPSDSDGIIVWLRDGWSCAQKDVEDAARKLGNNDPTVHVYLPRKSADDLRSRIVEAEAAQQVIEHKGVPTGREGEEARSSMQSRLAKAQRDRDELVREIVHGAKVFKGGGSEEFGLSLAAKIETAARASLARLFPRFDDGDHHQWPIALKRAKDGSDQPFAAVGWTGATEAHPVAREVLQVIGGGATGSEVLRTLKAAPFGWSDDAIGTALVALHREGALRVTLNGQALAPAQLDQTKIKKAEFRSEKVRLSAQQKLALRGLYQKAGLPAKSGEEESTAGKFLDRMLDLARKAGGAAPLPACPDSKKIDDIKRLSGTDQLAAILDIKAELDHCIDDWMAKAELATKRVPEWDNLTRMVKHAGQLPIAGEVQAEVEAVSTGRRLLDRDDHVRPILAKVAAALRAAVFKSHDALAAAHDEGLDSLKDDSAWKGLDGAAQRDILHQVGLGAPVKPATSADTDLLQELDDRSLASRQDALDAVAARVSRARAEAAKRLKPKARTVRLASATLETEGEVRAWIDTQSKTLLEAIKEGPVIVG